MRRAGLTLHGGAWGGVALLCLQPSAVQAAQGDDVRDDRPEIVVTAQRRPERAEDVPISLTARSGEDLDRLQVIDTTGLDRVAPSLVMTRTSVFAQPFLRGVGKRSNLGIENSVATYVDGVYLASPISALLDLRGIERIEILNGPQGTLFGRNATGGVIQVVTRDPAAETSGAAELQAGTDGYLRGDAYLSGGSDRIAGNFAISMSRNGGYGTNLFTGRSSQGAVDHSLVARSKWIWRPAEGLKLTLAGDYQDLDQDWPLSPAAGYVAIGQPRAGGFQDGDHDTPNRFRFHYGGVSLRSDVEIGSLTLMSLTALRRMHARWSLDLDTGPQFLAAAFPLAEQDQFSQELQLQSGVASHFHWVAGLYYIDLDERYDPTTSRYGGIYSAAIGGRTEQTLFARGEAASYAFYAQGTVPIGQATALTLGLRYTIEDRSVAANAQRLFDTAPVIRPIPGLPLLGQAPFQNSATFDKLTWRASLDHHFTEEVMIYVLASRGFQSGGWNLQTPQNPAFGPETLDDFEGGLKYASHSGRFRADVSVFYYDYSDLQVSALTAVGQATTNAASAELYGLELQLGARLGERTDLSFGAQLLEARFKAFPNATCSNFTVGAGLPYSAITCDVSGNRLPFAPEFKFNLGASHRVPLGRSGSLRLSGNFAYNSGYFAEPDNVLRQDAYATVDLSAEWRPNASGLSVRLWTLNLTNAQHYNSLATVQTLGILQNPAAPRRFGASIGYSF
jgi:outer membrane receptor protein involved in Fe transport